MRICAIVLLVAVFILPGLAVAQVGPEAFPPSQDAPDAGTLLAQGPGGFPPPPLPGGLRSGGSGGFPPAPPVGLMSGPGFGAWWRDSEIVKKLSLSQAQVGKIEQTFLDHRIRLIDLRADLEKQELSLQPLLDADRPDEAKVVAQIDLITSARGRLEKDHALLLLAVRRVLSVDQWKQLQALQQERLRGGHSAPGRQSPPPPPR